MPEDEQTVPLRDLLFVSSRMQRKVTWKPLSVKWRGCNKWHVFVALKCHNNNTDSVNLKEDFIASSKQAVCILILCQTDRKQLTSLFGEENTLENIWASNYYGRVIRKILTNQFSFKNKIVECATLSYRLVDHD